MLIYPKSNFFSYIGGDSKNSVSADSLLQSNRYYELNYMAKKNSDSNSKERFEKALLELSESSNLFKLNHPPEGNPSSNKTKKIISHKYRFIYVEVPKAASRTILRVLRRGDLEIQSSTLPLSELLQSEPDLKKYHRFSSVRNPWSRLVSTWRNKILDPENPQIVNNTRGLQKGMKFADFLEVLMNSPIGNDLFADRHWKSQYTFISDQDGNPLVDTICRMENLAEDLQQVFEVIGLPDLIPDSLPRLNVTRKKDEDFFTYREYFSPEQKNQVSRRYSTDIMNFDYSF